MVPMYVTLVGIVTDVSPEFWKASPTCKEISYENNNSDEDSTNSDDTSRNNNRLQ